MYMILKIACLIIDICLIKIDAMKLIFYNILRVSFLIIIKLGKNRYVKEAVLYVY